jgi:hypothetical protein
MFLAVHTGTQWTEQLNEFIAPACIRRDDSRSVMGSDGSITQCEVDAVDAARIGSARAPKDLIGARVKGEGCGEVSKEVGWKKEQSREEIKGWEVAGEVEMGLEGRKGMGEWVREGRWVGWVSSGWEREVGGQKGQVKGEKKEKVIEVKVTTLRWWKKGPAAMENRSQ